MKVYFSLDEACVWSSKISNESSAVFAIGHLGSGQFFDRRF